MKKWLSLLLVGLLLVTVAACGGREEKPKATLQMEALIADGKYEEAYLYMETLDEDEAKAWENKLVYLPVETVPLDTNDTERKTYTYKDGLVTGILFETSYKAYAHTYTWDENRNLIRKECSYDYEPGQIALTKEGVLLCEGEKKLEKVYEYTYNQQGQLICEKMENLDGEVEINNYTHDDKGNLLKEEFLRNDGETSVESSYDYIYTYDEQGRKTSEQVDGFAEKFTWAYDDAGNVTEYTYADGEVQRRQTTSYNEAGDPVEKVYVDGLGVVHTTHYTYNEKGLPVLEELSESDGYTERTTYTYDEQNRMLSYTVEDAQREIEKEEYTYNEAGKQTSVVRTYYNSGHEAYFSTENHYTYNGQGQQLTRRYKDRNNVWYEYTKTYDTSLFEQSDPLYGLGRLTGETMSNGYESTSETTYKYEGDVSAHTADHLGYRSFVEYIDYNEGEEYMRNETHVLFYYPEGMPQRMAEEMDLVDTEETDPMKWLAEQYLHEDFDE